MDPIHKPQPALQRYEFIVLLAFFLLFLAFTLPGISWGAPDYWHPDEIVVRSIKALHGEWKFSEINFDYPDLPQYAMFWLGKLILALGYTDKEILVASRVLSAVLAGLTILLTYIIARRAGGNITVAGLSGLFLLCVSGMSHNGRFAHNDTYITFFSVLTVLFLINYLSLDQRGWLYASFLSVGMATSSKYNGITLVLVPALLYLMKHGRTILQRPLRTFETLFIGGTLTYLGFAIGTPKSFFWMSYYFKRMIPALLHTGNYGRQPGSVRGFLGQYAVLADGLGVFLFLLFAAGFLWAAYRVIVEYFQPKQSQDQKTSLLVVPVLAILAQDLPIMLSYNYQERFFLPMMPMLAITAAFFVAQLHAWVKQHNAGFAGLLNAGITLLVLYSLARNLSVMLLFFNDARIPASAYIRSLPIGTSLEHTYYPPSLPVGHFEREHNYPVYFIKVEGDPFPTSKKYVFNAGEIGLNERKTDYLVTDSFTYERFNDPYICATMQTECEFFNQLETGRSNHYQLIAEFSYTLPPYLPKINVLFANPTIRIYERIQ
jgi:4-amino-4-deoxy-L-arabinose transferase-like glycosyltransferase